MAQRHAATRADAAARSAEAKRLVYEPHFERLCAAASDFARRARNVGAPTRKYQWDHRGALDEGQLPRSTATMRMWQLQWYIRTSSDRGADARPGIYVGVDGRVYVESGACLQLVSVLRFDEADIDRCIELMAEFLTDPERRRGRGRSHW